MTTAAVFGCTGAVGSYILHTLLEENSGVFASVKTISRRLPKPRQSASPKSTTTAAAATNTTTPSNPAINPSSSSSPNSPLTHPKLESLLESNTSQWAPLLSTLTPKPSVVFNAVGTTRSAAGSIQAQWKIDHDLCIENARAAKDAGVSTYIFISGSGTRGFLSKYVPYSKMKNGVEDAVRDLGFEHAVVVKPGMILGEREGGEHKSWVLETVLGNLHWVSRGLQDAVGQDQKIIARAAVAAARLAQENKAPSKYWVLEQADIVRLGRDEWKE